MKALDEIQFTRYLPFKIRGRIGGEGSIQAVIKAEDAEVGEITWVVNLGAAGRASVPRPNMGIELLTRESLLVLARSLSFSQTNIAMGVQNKETNISIPFFSTLIKFLTYFIQQEQLKVPFEERTGMIQFSAMSGGTSARPGINARDRVYLLIAKQLEQQGLCTIIKHSAAGFTVMLSDFVDKAARANLIRRI